MPPAERLLIFGASVRAAAFSALRTGLRPWCADLFNDTDLQARCPTFRISPGSYPEGFIQASHQGPPGPWMYTGGLENRPELVQQLSHVRSLWGNDAASLRIVRSPVEMTRLLLAERIPCPEIRLHTGEIPHRGRWLVKPRASAGGTGINFWDGGPATRSQQKPVYFQEYIEGDACAAVYLGDGRKARLLGVTRQLVGEPWLHAAPFHYCGSIGPLELTPTLRQALERLGKALVKGCSLRGLFGVDYILKEGIPWPVEINPRYPASVEVLEHALGLPILALHRSVFDPSGPKFSPLSPSGGRGVGGEGPITGKAILFARSPLTFPQNGPWSSVLGQSPNLHELLTFADIPPVGQSITTGKPILTFFAHASTEADCMESLRRIAADLDHRLPGP